MADHNATDAVSGRNVLKTAGGLIAGSTMLAGLGAAATEAEPDPQFEIEDANEELVGREDVKGDDGLIGKVDEVDRRSRRNKQAHRQAGNLPFRGSTRDRDEQGVERRAD